MPRKAQTRTARKEEDMTKAPDRVRELMTVGVVTVTPEDTVETALRRMIDHDIGAVVVVEGSSPVGVFTERDVTRRVLTDRDLLARPVREVMSAPVVTTEPDAEIVFVFETMNERKIRRLPVVEDGRLVGILTERDLLRWVDAVAHE
ncbi:MAG: histidine kinase [Actinomycetota bacterium]|nr:MAG: histidine kinase [Actinomycetota bacterium]